MRRLKIIFEIISAVASRTSLICSDYWDEMKHSEADSGDTEALVELSGRGSVRLSVRDLGRYFCCELFVQMRFSTLLWLQLDSIERSRIFLTNGIVGNSSSTGIPLRNCVKLSCSFGIDFVPKESSDFVVAVRIKECFVQLFEVLIDCIFMTNIAFGLLL